MPMLLAGRKPDDVARANLFDRAALALYAAAANVTISVWPSGWMCQAVRPPGSKVTIAPPTRAGPSPLNGVSILTEPVNQSAGPLADGCEPFR